MGRALRRSISREDVGGLSKGIIIALPSVNHGPEGSAATWVVTDTAEEAKRGARPLTEFPDFSGSVLQTPKVLLFAFRTKQS